MFWISIALTGPPPFSASASPVSAAPTRDWSSRRTLGSRASSPSIIVLSSLKYAAVGMQGAAALVRPGAADDRHAQRRVHVGRAVALAREAVAEAEERALVAPDQRRELLDRFDRQAGDRARPLRRARLEMRLERLGRVGVAREIGAVGEPVAEQDVHDRAGERAVRAGLQPQREVGLAHRLGVVDVDDDDLRAALLARPRRVGHQVDLGRDGVGAPDDDDVGLRHFARIDAGDAAGAGEIARPGGADADRAEEARVALDVGEALDPVAHHQPHRAGVEVRPDAFGAEAALGVEEALGDAVERLVPADRRELAGALRPDAHERPGQAVGMMDALGVARDLGADDARGVALLFSAAHAPDALAVDHLDVERAGRRAVVWANRRPHGRSRRQSRRQKNPSPHSGRAGRTRQAFGRGD